MSENKIPTRVGLFMLIGLATAGALIVYFGRIGEGMRQYYRLNVNYSNASGIKKGADVLLSGARVGRVADSPSISPDMEGVNVPLMIHNNVIIPTGSRFTIGSSGLLGDRFVDIVVDKNNTKAAPLTANATIKGEREAAIGDIIINVNRIAEQASTLMNHIDTAVRDVDLVAKKVHEDLLQKDGLKNLAITLANMKSTSEKFVQSSKRIDGILTSTNTTISDFRSLLQTSKRGEGTLGLLLNNPEMASNVRAFILNLRKHGVLWYKNNSE